MNFLLFLFLFSNFFIFAPKIMMYQITQFNYMILIKIKYDINFMSKI